MLTCALEIACGQCESSTHLERAEAGNECEGLKVAKEQRQF